MSFSMNTSTLYVHTCSCNEHTTVKWYYYKRHNKKDYKWFKRDFFGSIHFFLGKGVVLTSACLRSTAVKMSVKCTVKMLWKPQWSICLDHLSVGNLLLPPEHQPTHHLPSYTTFMYPHMLLGSIPLAFVLIVTVTVFCQCRSLKPLSFLISLLVSCISKRDAFQIFMTKFK